MSNFKAQSPNQIQSSNEMPKQVQGVRNQNPILTFDIHLAFEL
jgi:hypothetical protein